jgi:glycerophosphoryl diester phosphodiesterase
MQFITTGALACASAAARPAAPLDRAHAHNDYVHARPLLDALERGFNSVEADIHLVNGELLVAHHRDSVEAGRTLERLYLEPLRARVRANGGRVHPGRPPLLLLVDIKSDSLATWAALEAALGRYAEILTTFAGDSVVEGAVLAVVSGNRPLGAMRAAPVRLAAYDGRLPDLALAPPAAPRSLIPLVSDNWERITRWRGDGPVPDEARRALASAVERAHRQGRRIRFWNTPDREEVWRLLYDAGVDVIGADDLDALRGFLLRQPAREAGAR